jgi:hypothetical protein
MELAKKNVHTTLHTTLLSTEQGAYFVTVLVHGLTAVHAVWDAAFPAVRCDDGKKA